MFPLPVAPALLRGAYASESYGPIMAGAALSAVPLFVVFLIANRRIVDSNRKARQARKEIPHPKYFTAKPAEIAESRQLSSSRKSARFELFRIARAAIAPPPS